MPEDMKDWRKLSFNVPITEVATNDDPNGSPMEPSDFKIKGIAINETTTRNGVTYLAEELEPAAESFRDKPILKDHTNSVDSIVGRTTDNVIFDRNLRAIRFEARIMDEKMRQMILDGRIKNVSIGAIVSEIQEFEPTEGKTRMIARGIEGVEISLVAVPADKNASFAQAMFESFQLMKEQEATSTQSLILSKTRFETREEAVRWVRENGFNADKVDETEDSFRFRQFEPALCKEGSFRTITITDGVSSVICRKETGEACKVDATLSKEDTKMVEEVKTPEVQTEKIEAFGTQEEYAEFLQMKEEAKKAALREEIRKELKAEMAEAAKKVEEKVAEPVKAEEKQTTKGVVVAEKSKSVAEELKNYVIARDDGFSKGWFMTRKAQGV